MAGSIGTEELESQIKAACEAEEYGRAATLVLEHYGDELLSFLIARLRSHSDADEVFSTFAENLWVGLPRFQFRSSMRTWAYTIARNAANRFATSPHQRGARRTAISEHPELSELVDRVRSRTQAYLRTANKDRVRALREQLEPEDQMLLVLRIDRKMSWRDLATVLHGDESGQSGDETISREAARLRKRFERVKAELKQLAKAEGLI